MIRKKIVFVVLCFFVLLLLSKINDMNYEEKTKNDENNYLFGNVLSMDKSSFTMQDSNNSIYTFYLNDKNFSIGDFVAIQYSGVLNQSKDIQDCQVVGYSLSENELDQNGIPKGWDDNGIFHNYYKLAYDTLKKLSLKEKIGQLLLVRYPDNPNNAIQKYKVSGFVFYEKDFANKDSSSTKKMIKDVQDLSTIPLLTAVDEEGGNVVRISSNSSLVPNKFLSPSELYADNGFTAIKEDTIYKSKVLANLGINVNLAPVVDVSTNSSDYIFERTLKENTSLTSTYSKTVIAASKGTGVSYTLKHFPGYGNNTDTHLGTSSDSRTLNDIKTNDLPPFKSGIDEGAEAVLVSHNIVTSIDGENPASLSTNVHNLLRNDLNFTGIVITDDIHMNALNSIENVAVKALLAGNDLIITSNYEESFTQIENAIENGVLSEEQINKLAFRILSWKYYKQLLGNSK